MNVIVVGMGEVGKHIAQLLSFEFHNVLVIDSSAEAIRIAEEKMDIMAIRGHGASPKTLNEAQVGKADLLISVTNHDETNLLSANLAKNYGCKQTIARVSNKEFLPSGRGFYHDYLGANLIVNPNILTAIEISKLIKSSYALSSYNLCENQIQVVEYIFNKESKLLNKSIYDIKLPEGVSIAAIFRDGILIFPEETDEILFNDHIFFIGLSSELLKLDKVVDLERYEKGKQVVLAGGGDIALDVALELESFDIKLAIIEADIERCEFLANRLGKADILHSDLTQPAMMDELEHDGIDLFISLSDNDEENLISSLLAKGKGAKKNIILAQKQDNIKTFEQLGLDISISPRILAANQILKFIQRKDIPNIYNILDGKFEIMEFLLHKSNKVVGKNVSELNLPSTARVILVYRSEKSIHFATDDCELQEENRIIVWLNPSDKESVERIFIKKTLLSSIR